MTATQRKTIHVDHDLKTWPEPYRAVFTGDKKHEIRVNDRDFKVGDILCLQEFDPERQEYTSEFCLRRVTYLTPGGQWGLPDNLCVMSIEPVEGVL